MTSLLNLMTDRKRFALLASQILNLFVSPLDFIWLQMIRGFSSDAMEVFSFPISCLLLNLPSELVLLHLDGSSLNCGVFGTISAFFVTVLWISNNADSKYWRDNECSHIGYQVFLPTTHHLATLSTLQLLLFLFRCL